jgi:MoaA/NifB/PqqE/SkfB family radical SAM enzyme
MAGMNLTPQKTSTADYGPRRLTVELTNICNLHCSYCLRDEDALYHNPANFLPVELFARVTRDARDSMGIAQVMFTGGEPTLHPDFGKLLAAVAALDLKCSFVTNGWHFERVWPLLIEHREAVTHVSFSLDGATREAHDHWRGEGSFERVVRAFSRCWANNFPFNVKVGIRRDTVPQLEAIALFAARLGAAGLSFAHIMPTSIEVADASALSLEERADAEREIALLARIFKMRIGIDVGYYNTDLTAPCSALIGVSGNINYRGHLSLCCNLSGFRGGKGDEDIIADLNREDFNAALPRLQHVAATQSENRISALTTLAAAGQKADLLTGSPCLFCLNTLGKTPWSSLSPTSTPTSSPASSDRTLPVLRSLV